MSFRFLLITTRADFTCYTFAIGDFNVIVSIAMWEFLGQNGIVLGHVMECKDGICEGYPQSFICVPSIDEDFDGLSVKNWDCI